MGKNTFDIFNVRCLPSDLPQPFSVGALWQASRCRRVNRLKKSAHNAKQAKIQRLTFCTFECAAYGKLHLTRVWPFTSSLCQWREIEDWRTGNKCGMQMNMSSNRIIQILFVNINFVIWIFVQELRNGQISAKGIIRFLIQFNEELWR